MLNFQKLLRCGSWVLVLLLYTAISFAQNTDLQKSHCFRIHICLNGKPIDGPQVIMVKTKQSEIAVNLEEGCFKIPPRFLAEKELDVFFTVLNNHIHLYAISSSFFTDPWDIYLEDKKFNRDVVLPPNARVQDTCMVVFRMGDPQRILVQSGCRSSQ